MRDIAARVFAALGLLVDDRSSANENIGIIIHSSDFLFLSRRERRYKHRTAVVQPTTVTTLITRLRGNRETRFSRIFFFYTSTNFLCERDGLSEAERGTGSDKNTCKSCRVLVDSSKKVPWRVDSGKGGGRAVGDEYETNKDVRPRGGD